CPEPVASHDAIKAAMRPIVSEPASRGAWPSSGTSTTSSARRRLRMASTVACDRMSELAPRITITGTRPSASNSFHRVGNGCAGPIAAGGAAGCGAGWGTGPPPGLLEAWRGEGGPVVAAPFGKRVGEPPLQGVGCRGKARELRQLADITLDPHQALKVDHRADVVEHAAGDRSRSGDSKEHGQDAAARGSHECRPADVERGEHGKDIGEFDRQIVVRRLAVVVGFAAAAIIERT